MSKLKIYMLSLQVLITEESVKVHRQVTNSLPIIKRLAMAKTTGEPARLACSIMDQMSGYD